jgi:hypothetical protein
MMGFAAAQPILRASAGNQFRSDQPWFHSAMTRESKTAAEFLAGLRRSPQFVARERIRAEQSVQREETLRREQIQLLSELKKLGISIESIWDLVNSDENYSVAIPTLVRHLSLPYSAGVKEGIIRALTVEFAGSDALCELMKEFRKQNDSSETSLKWILGNAIATVAKASDADALVALATDSSHGKARTMIVSALPHVINDKRRLEEILHCLMRDGDVGEFARRAAFGSD